MKQKSTFYDNHNFIFLEKVRQWLWRRRLRPWTEITIKSLLDLGCGCGTLTELFKENTDELKGCDISQEEIKIARSKNSKINYFYHNIDENIPLKKVNVLTSIGVLHHTKGGIKNLLKYEASHYVIALYHKKGIYSFLYKYLKFKDWSNHIIWKDSFMTPIVHFYGPEDIPKEFTIRRMQRLWISPLTIYWLNKK